MLTNNHTSAASKGTTAEPSVPKSSNNDADGQMSKLNSTVKLSKIQKSA